MVEILNNHTSKDKYPKYLIVVNQDKIIKYNTSIWRFWKKKVAQQRI